MTHIYQFKSNYLFLSFCIIYILIFWATNTLVLNDNYYISAFGSQLDEDRIYEMINTNHRFLYLYYICIVLFLLLKFITISFVLYTGLFLYDLEVTFYQCLKVTLISEIVFIIANIVKLFFFLSNTPETVSDIQFFYPLSLIQFFSKTQTPTYLVYPIQQCNLFEVAYWVLMTIGIQTYAKKTFFQALKITASSYGVAMFLWILLIVFVQLQFN